MNKPRILILENSPAVTGAFKSILGAAECLQSKFIFYFVIQKGSSARRELERSGIQKIVEWRMVEIRKHILAILLYLPVLVINSLRLKTTVRLNNINLVHVNDLYNLIPPVARMLGSRTPYVCHVRFMPDNFPRLLFNFWVRIHLRFAERIVVVSEVLRRRLPQDEKIVMIHDGFLFRKLNVEVADARLTDSIFLYPANIIRGKGQDLAIEAFRRIHARLPGWKLRFIGGSMGLGKNQRYFMELKRMVDSYGLKEKIEWAGFTEDVETEYKNGDIVLNFSKLESFSMTILEALSYGRAVIATDSGGPGEIIRDGETGVLVRNGDVGAMADAMYKLACNADLRKQFGRMGQKSALENFNLEDTSQRLSAIYMSHLKNFK